MNNDGLCLLCAKLMDPKWRIKIVKHGQETEVSKVLSKLVGDDVILGNIVCNSCLTKAKNSDIFVSQTKDSVNFIRSTSRTKPLLKESPKSESKKNVLKDITNTPKSIFDQETENKKEKKKDQTGTQASNIQLYSRRGDIYIRKRNTSCFHIGPLQFIEKYESKLAFI